MTFFTSLSGLRAAQTDLGTISNNVANVNSVAFKRSRAYFGDIFASAPNQSSKTVAGQGTRLTSITQQFTQGALESTEKVLDMAIAGDGFFVVKGDPPRSEVAYTRNGSFAADVNRRVIDTRGSVVQLLPVDANGNVTSTGLGNTYDFLLPTAAPGNPAATLLNISVGIDGLVTATYADGSDEMLGKVALASFTSQEGLRPIGDAHWQSTLESGSPIIEGAASGPLGAVRSGTLERSNVDVTEELVLLISAQRNFQANAKAIETASNMTQSIININ
jgi:flagellar hook protein FlgE